MLSIVTFVHVVAGLVVCDRFLCVELLLGVAL